MAKRLTLQQKMKRLKGQSKAKYEHRMAQIAIQLALASDYGGPRYHADMTGWVKTQRNIYRRIRSQQAEGKKSTRLKSNKKTKGTILQILPGRGRRRKAS